MRVATETDQARAETDYAISHMEKVLYRYEQFFGEDFEQLTELFRHTPDILEELGFQEVGEFYSERWETLPFKTDIYATRWKDPYTAIRFQIKVRVKEPYSDHKTTENMYKGKLKIKAYVVETKYPNWEIFEKEPTMFQRSWFYGAIMRIIRSWLFRKEHERYKEEAQELAIAFVSRMREIQTGIPAIGRSKREWYTPEEE